MSLRWSNGLVLSELVCPVCLQNYGKLNWKTCYRLIHALLFYRLAGCMPFRRAEVVTKEFYCASVNLVSVTSL